MIKYDASNCQVYNRYRNQNTKRCGMNAVQLLNRSLLPCFATYQLPTHLELRKAPLMSIWGKVLLCTENGFQWVSLTSLEHSHHHVQHSPEHLSSSGSPYKCAICYLVAVGLKDASLERNNYISHYALFNGLHFNLRFISNAYQFPPFLLGPLSRAPPAYSWLLSNIFNNDQYT